MNWKKLKAGFARAFAYSDGRSEITEADIALLDKAADFVVKRGLVTPAVLLLESSVPLHFVGSSLMTFFRPMVAVVFKVDEYEQFERLLEKRCAMELLAERIVLKDRQRAERRKGGAGPPSPV